MQHGVIYNISIIVRNDYYYIRLYDYYKTIV